jgi:hypothetical protein
MKEFKRISTNKIRGVALVDAVNSNSSRYKNVKNPPGFLFDFLRNSCPFGFADLILDLNLSVDSLDLIYQLPANIRVKYFSNLRKCKLYQTLVSEWEYFGISAVHVNSVTFDSIPLLNFPSGKGINSTELVKLSTNSKMVYFQEATHFTPFSSNYSKIIAENVVQMVQTIRSG